MRAARPQLRSLLSARAQAEASEAAYRQVIGDDPGRLQPGQPLAKMLPKSVDQAIAIAAGEHPAIIATEHLVDAAAFAVKSTEGALSAAGDGVGRRAAQLSEHRGVAWCRQREPMELSTPLP